MKIRGLSLLLVAGACLMHSGGDLDAASAQGAKRNSGRQHVAAGSATDKNIAGNPFSLMTTMRSNGGWMLMLKSTKHWERVETRPLESDIWTPAQSQGEYFMASFADLAPMAEIEVRGMSADGDYGPPQLIRFDAMKAIEKQAMDALRVIPRAWLGLTKEGTGLYFSTVVSWRCGLEEVRYSIDSDALDQVYNLPECDFDDPMRIPNTAKLYLELQPPAEYVAAQLVYADGSVSDVVKFRPGMGM